MGDRDVDVVSPMWMAHHFPDDYERCAVVGRRHVCRRCLVLYPIAFVVLGVGLALGWTSGPASLAALIVLPLPAVVEFVAEHLGRLRYSARRQMAVTVPLGLGLGAGFARYLDDQTDPAFWAVAVAYSAVCLLSAWFGSRWRNVSGGQP